VKRAAIVTGLTIVGIGWILNYRVTPHLLGVTAVPPNSDANPAPSPTLSAPAAVNGTFTGADVPNRFGDVVVRVVITNGHMNDVQAIQLPFDRQESAYISQQAGPLLRTEALQAQSANIDIISGATYTSQSYAQSLESALQQAHLG
jgi:uncharacterized protein with FMN-binding domain